MIYQKITILLKLKEHQAPYQLVERNEYEALEHFFKNLDYRVGSISSDVEEF